MVAERELWDGKCPGCGEPNIQHQWFDAFTHEGKYYNIYECRMCGGRTITILRDVRFMFEPKQGQAIKFDQVVM